MARVLIVYPNIYDPCMPMGITSLSSYLKNAGHDVRLFDTTLYKIDDTLTKPEVYIRDKVFKPHKLWYSKIKIAQGELYNIYKKCIDDYDPDVIAVSIGAQDMLVMGDDLINWTSDIKRPDTILAIGGVIPSCLPDRFIDKCDAVCVGEGELSLLDIVNGSKGIVHGKVVDVDDLLYPDWDLMSEMYMLWPFGARIYRFGRFMRTRGCPNRCLDGNTLILMADGTSRKLSEIQIGDRVASMQDSDNYYLKRYCGTSTITYCESTVQHKWETTGSAVKISMESGSIVTCSEDHRWLTDFGWKYTTGENWWVGQRPHLTTNNSIYGISKDSVITKDRVGLIEVLGKSIPMYDITTSTGNFVANGLISHNCTYCTYSNPDFPKDMSMVRRKSNEVMINEIMDRVGKYNLQFITFVDDNFLVGSEDTSLEFLDIYRNKVHLPFLTTTHPGTMTSRLAKAMKDAGSIHISMAIESGDEYIRRNILGRKISDDTMIEAFRLVKEQGIHCASLNMIGLPHETPGEFRNTIDLNRKCMPDKSMCYYFQPYIGLPLREEAIRYGYITGKEPAVNMCDESIMKLPGFPMSTMRNYKETFNIRIRFPKYISRFMGWLAGRSQFIFNILSKYRSDKL